MAEGQGTQSFGGKIVSDVEFKTETGLGVKLYVRPAAMFCSEFEKWLKTNEIYSFDHSLIEFNGNVAAIITYGKKDRLRPEELMKESMEALLSVVNRLSDVTDVVKDLKQAVDSAKVESVASEPV